MEWFSGAGGTSVGSRISSSPAEDALQKANTCRRFERSSLT